MTVFSTLSGWLGGPKMKGNRFADMAAFREHIVAAVKRQPGIDDVVASPSDPAKFEIKIAGQPTMADLTNIFGHLNAYPDEDVDNAIARFVRSMTEPRPGIFKAEEIVAMIRNREYIDHVSATGVDIHHEPLGADLSIVYMIDRPDSMLSLSREDVQQLDLQSLRRVALINVRRHLGRVVANAQLRIGVLYFVEGNTMLSTSLILLDEFWRSIEARFPGDVLIALPRKDQLFVFDEAHPDAKIVARRLIDVTFRDNFNLLSQRLYARRGGQIVFVDD